MKTYIFGIPEKLRLVRLTVGAPDPEGGPSAVTFEGVGGEIEVPLTRDRALALRDHVGRLINPEGRP